jgi:predicted kinase
MPGRSLTPTTIFTALGPVGAYRADLVRATSVKLILMAGLPRAGKTTVAQSMDAPIVSPDAIRLALHGKRFLPEAEPMVWTMAKYMAKALFLAGYNRVVIDATNTTEKRRQEWIDAFERFPVRVSIELILVPTPRQICVDRAMACDRGDLVPIIDRMAKQWDFEAVV